MDAKLVIFDFDGTLADTQTIILETYKSTIETLKLSQRKTPELKATIGLPLRDGFVKLYPELSSVEIDLCCDTYRNIFNKNKQNYVPELFPGVEEVLETLRLRNITMSIASSRSRVSLEEFCREKHISRYFALILGAEDVKFHKPNPWPVTYTLERMNVSPSDAVVVGDMPYDIKMGMDAGCRTVGVSYGNATFSDLIEAGANRVIPEISLLPDLEL